MLSLQKKSTDKMFKFEKHLMRPEYLNEVNTFFTTTLKQNKKGPK